MTTPQGPGLRTLIEQALDLEEIDGMNLFRSKQLWKPTDARGVFGGQVIGHALSAATKTVDPKFSVHETTPSLSYIVSTGFVMVNEQHIPANGAPFESY
ncbi:hypothetical protein HK104_002765 [Borealophlyctis nickersoniae]|nr:hypothetical protein HK104_002765 [Borealophlyctis nickersoniae]